MECKGVAVVIVEDEGICDLICEKLAENDYGRFKSLVTNRIEEI